MVRNLSVAKQRPLENCTFCTFCDLYVFYTVSYCSPTRPPTILKIWILGQFCTLFLLKFSDFDNTVYPLRYRSHNVQMSKFSTYNFSGFIFFLKNKILYSRENWHICREWKGLSAYIFSFFLNWPLVTVWSFSSDDLLFWWAIFEILWLFPQIRPRTLNWFISHLVENQKDYLYLFLVFCKTGLWLR